MYFFRKGYDEANLHEQAQNTVNKEINDKLYDETRNDVSADEIYFDEKQEILMTKI